MLRARGVRQNNLAARLALGGLLSSADLRLPGLPPSAVLIVHQVSLPAIEAQWIVSGGGRIDPAWERAAREVLVAHNRQPARPALGPVPAHSTAVFFADDAELLACLVLDVSLGQASECWWWQMYRKRWGILDRHILPAPFLDSPRSVPAALRLLAQRGKAGSVLQVLSPGESRQVLSAVCNAFGIAPPNLSEVWSVEPPRPSPDHPETPIEASASVTNETPWRDWLPSAVTADLTPESACLLGVALTLAHAPSVARTSGFRMEVERWWRLEIALRNHSDLGAQLKTPQQGNSRPAKPSSASAEPAESPAAVWVVESEQVPDGGASDSSASMVRPEQPFGLDHSRDLPLFRPAAQIGQHQAAPSFLEKTDTASYHDNVAEKQPVDRLGEVSEAVPMSAAAFEDGVATELGGVLFLINVMLHLDLPGCLAVQVPYHVADWRLECQIGPWEVLELLARGFLAEQVDLTHDSLWLALAALDGRRSGELPGAHFVGFVNLHIPVSWARQLGGDESVQPVDLNQVAPLDGPLLVGINLDLRRWLAAMLPLIHKMLQRALGADFDIVTGLLMRTGRCYLTASHVDLVMPLNSVSLPVRRAGLDFDPGWQPGFGRVVQFHYE